MVHTAKKLHDNAQQIPAEMSAAHELHQSPCVAEDTRLPCLNRLADLRRRLRRERTLGRCGHVSYSVSRHLALKQMVKAWELKLQS